VLRFRSGFIPIAKLPELLGRLDAPLGWNHKELRRTERLKFLKLLDIPVRVLSLRLDALGARRFWVQHHLMARQGLCCRFTADVCAFMTRFWRLWAVSRGCLSLMPPCNSK
jgi:hypothetical protein